jgi:hypothetical protein
MSVLSRLDFDPDVDVFEPDTRPGNTMKPFDIRPIEKQDDKLVEAVGNREFLEREKDVGALLGLRSKFEADGILLHRDIFPASIFDLKSRHAGTILQWLVNYRTTTAAVFSRQQIHRKFESSSLR